MSNEIKLAPIFSEGAVLQGNKPVRVFGWGNPGTILTVCLEDETIPTIIPATGKWIVTFSAHKYGDYAQLSVFCGIQQITVNVIFGEVILFAGQSNMEYKLKDDADFKEELAEYDSTNISYFYTPQIEFENHQTFNWQSDTDPSWEKLSKTNLGEISAIAYYAIKNLSLNVSKTPIGILECYKGGTSASCWISKDNLVADNELDNAYLKPFTKNIEGKSADTFKREVAAYEITVNIYNQKKADYISEHPELPIEQVKEQVGHTPWPPVMTPESYLRPNGLYQTMVQKIVPYTVSRIVWYQGENDADHPGVYQALLQRLILEWRVQFMNDKLPFYIVQLPIYVDEPADAWAEIREAQLENSNTLPEVHLISITDTGEHHNIHPVHKKRAGSRVGEILSKKHYSNTPRFDKLSYQDGQMKIYFKDTNKLKSVGQTIIYCLYHDQWKVVSDLKVHDNYLAFDSKQIPDRIKYAYENAPTISLFNEVGYPVSPFNFNLTK